MKIILDWDSVYEPVLVLLARRYFPNEKQWLIKKLNLKCYCILCNQYIFESLTQEHGISHLREYNLLPFI